MYSVYLRNNTMTTNIHSNPYEDIEIDPEIIDIFSFIIIHCVNKNDVSDTACVIIDI